LGLGAASAAAQYVVTHPQPSHNPINLDFLLDPLSKSEFLSFDPLSKSEFLSLSSSASGTHSKPILFRSLSVVLGPYRVLSDNMLSDNEGFSVQVSGFSTSTA
jgi:hypothetical protein